MVNHGFAHSRVDPRRNICGTWQHDKLRETHSLNPTKLSSRFIIYLSTGGEKLKMGILTLTTDFGGHYLGIMKGVIRSIDANAEIFEITSDIDSYNVKEGAFILRSSYEFFPRGTIHLAVVDPGVGSHRKAIAVKTKNYTFVGPDNGLLTLAARHDGIISVRELSNPRLHRVSVSSTFHGRDIFAPVAAHLSSGGNWAGVGKVVDGLSDLQLLKEIGSDGSVLCEVVSVDRFGNLTLSLSGEDMELSGEVGIVHGEDKWRARVVQTYEGRSEGLLLLMGSAGYYEVAMRRRSAADVLRVKAGDRLNLVM
jgi:hypothetical protein